MQVLFCSEHPACRLLLDRKAAESVELNQSFIKLANHNSVFSTTCEHLLLVTSSSNIIFSTTFFSYEVSEAGADLHS